MAVLWLRFLTEIGEDTKEAPAELLANDQTRKALSIVEKSAMSDTQLYVYEQFMMSIIDEQVLREGFYKEGMEKGMAEGIQKGMEKGVAKATLDFARSMKQRNYPVKDIMELTGLSAADIDTL
jgi:predicted transposase/invertase (TIGR01784 family)